MNGLGADGDTIDRGGNSTSEDSFTQNLDLRLNGRFDTGAVAHTLVVGLDARRDLGRCLW